MSAVERAEARRKAILSRKNDRLAKLTTSARGEDAPACLHEDPPLASLPATSNFLGEASSASDMPAKRSSPSLSPQPKQASRNANILDSMNSSPPDPSVWSQEQQQQFMQLLMNSSPASTLPHVESGASSSNPINNPLAALLAGRNDGGNPMDGMFAQASVLEQPKEKTKLQKAMPLMHLFSMWCLLAYFIFWAEPEAYRSNIGEGRGMTAVSLWRRWADLGQQSPPLANALQTFKVQIVPFFWAFTTLQILLHSLRIFSGFGAVDPPALLAFILPHLPSPFPSLVSNSLRYMQMGSLFLDDLSGLVVGLGFIVYFSGWITHTST